MKSNKPNVNPPDAIIRNRVVILLNRFKTVPRVAGAPFEIVTKADMEFILNASIGQEASKTASRYVKPPVFIFGDVHGELLPLLQMLKESDTRKLMFLGNVVDRGAHSIETAILILASMLVSKNVILIRGNHETRAVNRIYGLHDELVQRFGNEIGHDFWKKINELFDELPFVATVSNGYGTQIFCIHSGLGPKVDTAKLAYLHLPTCKTENGMLFDLLWGKPSREVVDYSCTEESATNTRDNSVVTKGQSSVYGQQMVEHFTASNMLQCIVRGHEPVQNGIAKMFDGSLITVFSSPSYGNPIRSGGAVLHISGDMEMETLIM